MSETEARRALDRLPLLAGVPEAARSRLAAAARPVRHAAGAPIFRRGDPGEDGMLLVLDGLVRLHLSGADGREMSLGLVGPGEPVGEIALVDGGPRSADATALTPVSGLMLRHADAAAVIAGDAAAANAMLRTLAARLRRTTEQAEGLGIRSLPGRLASVLLRLAAADPSGLVRLPQGQIASLAAASRPKVNAVLAGFRDQRLVEPARAGLRLLDRPALKALAEGG
jgi:CRP/FNR family cyclic AMP-dependent transcriptional regulator